MVVTETQVSEFKQWLIDNGCHKMTTKKFSAVLRQAPEGKLEEFKQVLEACNTSITSFARPGYIRLATPAEQEILSDDELNARSEQRHKELMKESEERIFGQYDALLAERRLTRTRWDKDL